MTDAALELNQVARTLLLPLWGRAELTRAGSPILSDPRALELVSKMAEAGFDFARIRADLDYSKNLCWLARARQLDDKIRSFLTAHPNAHVVNLGAGLDTTFARVDNGRLRWIDLDVPEVIALRRKWLPESDRSRALAASLHDSGWMSELPERTPSLFIAGGVLFYFTEAQVMALLRQMGRRFSGSEIVFDAFTPAAVERANGMLQRVGMEDAVMRWGLADAKALESWGVDLEVLDQLEYFRGLDLRGVPFRTRIMTVANRLLRAMTVVHCRWR
jgi:O-methyltransferase involved in polyketide biosynthesis